MDSFLKPIMLNSSKKYKISSKNGAFDPLIPRLKSYTAYHTVRGRGADNARHDRSAVTPSYDN